MSCYLRSYRGTRLLLDQDRYVGAVLLGQPKDALSWSCVHDDAFDRLQGVASRLSFSPEESFNRRGSYPSVAHGLSFGGGQQVSDSVSLAVNTTEP